MDYLHFRDMCENYCTSKFGIWNYREKLCHLDLFAHEICIRVKKDSEEWIIDDAMFVWLLSLIIRSTYPLKKSFHAYDSDYLGCYYNNNWNSVVYGIGDHPVITYKVRSIQDSYIAASAYTKGCSSGNTIGSHCFGKTRLEERFGYLLLMIGSLLLILIEFCVRM